jgi:hypothetical protein
MANELIELIFLEVPDDRVDLILSELVRDARILELSHSELGDLIPKETGLGFFSQLQKFLEPSSVFLRLDGIYIGEILMSHPLIRVMRVDGMNEIAVLFDETKMSSASSGGWVSKLSKGANHIAEQTHISSYCCGLEPGTDEETQFFSNTGVGPLFSQ